MKKTLWLFTAALLLLGACSSGNDGAEGINEENNFDEELEEAMEFDDEDDMGESDEPSTDDPIEFVKEGKDGLILIDGFNEYQAKNYYVTDDTDEDGFNTYEDGEFTMIYAIIETENIAEVDAEGEEELQIFGEIINDTEDDFYFDDETVELITDDNEKAPLDFGLNGAGEADQKSKFIDGFYLEYDIPESFTLKVLDPKVIDWGETFEEDTGLDEYDYESELEDYMEDNAIIDETFHKE